MHGITPFFTVASLNDDEKIAKQIITPVTVLLYDAVYFAVFLLRYGIDYLSMKKCMK